MNRRKVAASIGVSDDQLVLPQQRHTTNVQVVSGTEKHDLCNTDGLVTHTRGLAVAVLTADCMPLLMADRNNGVVAAIHAGWRGLQAGIIESAIRKMELAGARRQDIGAVIGPAISQDNYEVGPEVLKSFVQTIPACEEFFRQNGCSRFDFDLSGLGLELLERSGIGRFERISRCTYGDEKNFFSCRRAYHRGESGFGLMISAISM